MTKYTPAMDEAAINIIEALRAGIKDRDRLIHKRDEEIKALKKKIEDLTTPDEISEFDI